MKKFFLLIVLLFIFSPFFVEAQDVLGQELVFDVESYYDFNQRTEITATLIKLSPTAYWYADNYWWENLDSEERAEVDQSLVDLTAEFEENIYPNLTRAFGSEWKPGIDKDTRVTILLHPMKQGNGGYTDTADEYPKAQLPESNEREMVYLNTQHVNTTYFKSFLAHELIHLITFNQKNKPFGVTEETWLNEARADYAPTLLGYDAEYKGSNLERRVKDFLEKPGDSLTEWRDTATDYGVGNLFIQYLVDHYGIDVLTESLRSAETGIKSINTVLSQHGFEEDFAQIFANWTITVLINDCQISDKYCYFNPSLETFRVTPLINYLPFVGQSTLSVNNTTKDWSGNWHKFIGGQGILRLKFVGSSGSNFQVAYVIEDKRGNLSIHQLQLDVDRSGEIFIPDFGSENVSLTIIPITQNKTSDFAGLQPSRAFSWSASTEEEEEVSVPTLTPLTKPIFQLTRVEVLARIAEINTLIAYLQNLLLEMGEEVSCAGINQNLYFGMSGNVQVRCLQEFLKNQGSDIYPEGIVNGNFYSLTQAAVIRFQEKYASEVLTPFGLTAGTGFVGPSTRAKINELLTK